MSITRRSWLVVLAGYLTISGLAGAGTTTLEAVADAELRQGTPTTAIGGDTFIAGGLGVLANNEIRRGVLRFDLSSIPSNAEVQSAEVRLRVVRVPIQPANSVFELRRLLTDWKEQEATWNQRRTAVAWDAAGAIGPEDIASAASAIANVAGLGTVTFATATTIVADIKGWLVKPVSNRGWLVRSQAETTLFTARHFAARETLVAGDRPQLVITYLVPPVLTQVRRESSELVFTFNALPGQTYHIESRTSLVVGDWVHERTIPPVAGEQLITERTSIAPDLEAKFRRLRVE